MITLLIISLILNVFFIWYVYTLLKKLLFVSENIGDFLEESAYRDIYEITQADLTLDEEEEEIDGA